MSALPLHLHVKFEMAATVGTAIVEINDEEYSIVKAPPENSAVVKDQRDRLLGAVDLESLVDDLGRLGKFVRIAYNGVAGFTELQIKIQDIGYDVTKLCDKSAITVAKFKKASSSVLVDLQATYQFLLDGLEDMAVDTLASVSKLAQDMAKAAEELHNDFERESGKVVDALKETQRTKGKAEEDKKKSEEELKEFEIKKQKTVKAQEMAMEAEAKAEAYYRDAQAREDKLLSDARNPLKNLVNGLTSRFAGVEVFDTKSSQSAAERAREEKMKHYECMKEQRELRAKALGDIAEFAIRMENCKDDQDLHKAAIDALHNAVGALKSLSAVMLKAALFWKQMQDHCKSLSQPEMARYIERAMSYEDEAKRQKVWTSTGFKIKAVEFYAGWVALHSVCTSYVERIKITQRDLYAYIQENPSIEESRVNVREMAKQFREDLAHAQKQIADQEFKAHEEVKALTSGTD